MSRSTSGTLPSGKDPDKVNLEYDILEVLGLRKIRQPNFFTESLILAQNERWRRV